MPEINNQALRPEASPEIEMLLYCARTHVDVGRAARIKTLAGGEMDWGRLLRIAQRHGLSPLLYRQLHIICPKLVPESHLEILRSRFNKNTARNLYLKNELCKVLRLLETHDIPAIPYKGVALATAVYGDLASRQFGDLDIFIRQDDVARASEILNLGGYRKEFKLTPAQEAAYLKIGYELTFTNNQGQIYVDLHWDFVPRYFSLQLDLESFWERHERVSLYGMEARSFAPEDLFLILCLNAGKEFWGRLILICDVAEMIKVYPRIDWHIVLSRASKMGISRMVCLSVLLAHDLLGADIPEEIRAEVVKDKKILSLTLKIKEELFREEVKTQSVADFLKPSKALRRRLDRIKFYLRLGLTPTIEDWTFINMPDRLSFLHYLSRPIRLSQKFLFRR